MESDESSDNDRIGATEEEEEEDGAMSVCRAASLGRLDVIRSLVEKGSTTKKEIDHCLFCASTIGIMRYLVEECSANILVTDLFGDTPLHRRCFEATYAVAQNEHNAIAVYLAERGGLPALEALDPKWQESPLMRVYCVELFKALLEVHEMDLNKNYGTQGKTLLHVISKKGHDSVVRFLLDQGGINVNATDHSGKTPIFTCPLQLLDLLVSHGADTSVRDHSGNTPLLDACDRHGGFTDKTRALLKAGADLNVTTADGRSPLHLACKSGGYETSQLLLEHGAFANAIDGEGNTPLITASEHCGPAMFAMPLVRLLIHAAGLESINHTNQHGRSALCGAASQQRPDVVRLLLDHGALVGMAVLEEAVKLRDVMEIVGWDFSFATLSVRMIMAAQQLEVIFLLIQARVSQLGDVRSSLRHQRTRKRSFANVS